jgi:DNA-binding transcriptional regulator/RsmH inhibitor MraZ
VFVGEYDRSVDGNGRVALPADFRDELDAKCYVRCHPEGYVSITSPSQFDREVAELDERIRVGEAPESERRAFGVSSSVAAIDKQGRITLDEGARRHAGIRAGGQAIIAGALTRLEVWRPSRYHTIRTEDGVVQRVRVWNDEDDEA